MAKWLCLIGSSASLLLMTGCRSSPELGWQTPLPRPGNVEQAVDLDELEQHEWSARDRETVEAILSQYLMIPGHVDTYARAQTGVARLELLIGAAYATSRAEQRHHYTKARQASERAMYTDPDFRKAVASGMPVAEAARQLEPDQFEPLFLWATSIFYTFRDVASLPEKILARKNLTDAASVLRHMMDTDETWYGGSLQFSLGIYYLAVPAFMGGDRQLAEELMNKAVELSNKRLLTRWGRAKYLAVANGDRELFEQDLQWVVSQNVDQMDGPIIWNAYFQMDAKRLLSQSDRLF